MTTKQQAYLKGWMKTGTDTYMPKRTFEKYSLDNELTTDEKRNLYNSGDRHTAIYETLKSGKRQVHSGSTDRPKETQQQPQKAAPVRQLSEQEIQELNPAFIDPRIESLKHLNPEQLKARQEVWK